jgi:hypothetical protein
MEDPFVSLGDEEIPARMAYEMCMESEALSTEDDGGLQRRAFVCGWYSFREIVRAVARRKGEDI